MKPIILVIVQKLEKLPTYAAYFNDCNSFFMNKVTYEAKLARVAEGFYHIVEVAKASYTWESDNMLYLHHKT